MTYFVKNTFNFEIIINIKSYLQIKEISGWKNNFFSGK